MSLACLSSKGCCVGNMPVVLYSSAIGVRQRLLEYRPVDRWGTITMLPTEDVLCVGLVIWEAIKSSARDVVLEPLLMEGDIPHVSKEAVVPPSSIVICDIFVIVESNSHHHPPEPAVP
mmetsp:Transcript_21347/g.30527  ORF Transcript_21347/g.30527 Transcript_21347/m.30527 type:complete len:118 (+) Transcript_21347:958-1311(+)